MTGKVLKEYDKNIQGYISALNFSKMEIPKNNKAPLGLIHSHIVFQLYLVSSKSFLIEITVTDLSKVK